MKSFLSASILACLLCLQVQSMRHLFLNWGDWKNAIPVIEMWVGSAKSRVRMKIDMAATVTQLVCSDVMGQNYNNQASATFELVSCGDAVAPGCACENGIC
jgi:hypothetical protein